MGIKDHLYITLLSVLLMLVMFQTLHPAGVIVYVVLSFVMELFIKLRRRVSIQCTVCGFDPVLYTKSPMQAEKNVRVVLQSKKDSLGHLLKGKNPFEHIKRPRIKDAKEINPRPRP